MTGNPDRHILTRITPPDGYTYHPSRADAERTIREELPGVTIKRTGRVERDGELVALIRPKPSNSGASPGRNENHARVEVLVSVEDKQRYQEAAERAGLRLAAWVKRELDAAAR